MTNFNSSNLSNIIKAISLLIISLSIGIGLGYLCFNKKDKGIDPIPNYKFPENEIIKEKEKIDSLKEEIKIKDSYIIVLKDSINNMKTIKNYKIDSIKNLPTTEGVEFLRNKLREFESKYQ